MDENTSMMGDWVPPSPTSKAFFASFLGGDEQISSGPMPQAHGQASSFGSHQAFEDNDSKAGVVSFGNDAMLSLLPDVKQGSRGGLGDRLAARAGFNAPRLDTESIRSNEQPSNDEAKLTIPPGISPTALLESPIFLSNTMTQPSPTTGKFPLFQDGNVQVFSMAANAQCKDDFFDDVNGSSFAFKPHPEPGLPFSLDLSNNMGQAMNPQFFPNLSLSEVQSNEGLSQSLNEKDHVEGNAGSEIRGLDTISGTAEHSPPLSDQQEDEGDQMLIVSPTGNGSSQAEDGYNWRKYGQKQVKGSEYPRSYYKCTHLNCPVKKKVERSPEGHVTEIIYNGAHTHPKPALHRRSSMGFNQLDDTHCHENGDDKASVWGATQNGLPREWRSDSFDYTSLNSMHSELCNPSPSLLNGAAIESGDAMAPSCTFSNDEDEDDRRTHGSVTIINDVEGDESESKRRKLETYAAEISGATRAIREPRVVVQTLSDVDILEDGYRWRKYGQKVVKGNPNPRSYYKCTSVGCTVRKHVERASHDLKSVITTYEGKHNHEVPPARNSSHANSSASSAFNPQPQSLIPRPEQSQITNMARYELPLNLGSFNMSMMPLGPMNQATLANFSAAGLRANLYPMLLQQQRQVNDMGFMMMPRAEAKVEPSSDANVYLSNGSSLNHQIMNRLPLGP